MKNNVVCRAMQRQSTRDKDDEEASTSVVETERNTNVVHRFVDVEKLDSAERREFMERVLKVDHEHFLKKIRSRIDE